MRPLAGFLLFAIAAHAQTVCPKLVPSEITLVMPLVLTPGPYPYATDKANFWVFCDTAPLLQGTPLQANIQGPLNVSGSDSALRDSDRSYLFPSTVSTLSTEVSPQPGTQKASIEFTAGSARATLPVNITFTSDPFIHVVDTNLVFWFPDGMQDQRLTFWTANTASAAAYTVAVENAPWLAVTPVNGSGYAELNAHPAGTTLQPGNYMGFIVITVQGAVNSPTKVPVRLFVPTPQMTVSHPVLIFSQLPGSDAPPPQMIQVSVDPFTQEPFTVISDSPWLTATPASGTTPQMISIQANGTGMAVGTYTGKLRIAADNAGPAEVVVTFKIGT